KGTIIYFYTIFFFKIFYYSRINIISPIVYIDSFFIVLTACKQTKHQYKHKKYYNSFYKFFHIMSPLCPKFLSVLLFIRIKSIKTLKNIKVDNAFITGFIPLLAIEYIVMLKFVTSDPVVKKLITKSSIERVKAIKAHVTIPGII